MLRLQTWFHEAATVHWVMYRERRRDRRIRVAQVQLDTALKEMQEAVERVKRCERLLDMILARERHNG